MPLTLDISRKELEFAKESLEKMNSSNDLDECSKLWNQCLDHIEKCWNKSEVECRVIDKKKFFPFQGRYTNLRRKDPLLRYVKNARDADQHTIQPIVEKKPGGVKIGFNEKGVIKIDEMKINNGDVKIKGDFEGVIRIEESRIVCVYFVNKGTEYRPPKSHLGSRIAGKFDPYIIGSIAIRFYERYLDKILLDFT